MIGKQKCSFLREIRRRIAEENEIPYQTKECTHTGECKGTCPYCESEVRYLESQLRKKTSLGLPIRLVSLCAGMAAALTGCDVIDTIKADVKPSPTPEEIIELSGEVPYPYEIEEGPEIAAVTAAPEIKSEPTATVPLDSTKPVEIIYNELSGYVPYN